MHKETNYIIYLNTYIATYIKSYDGIVWHAKIYPGRLLLVVV